MNGLAVFDLDGTLVDTAPDLIDTCNVVLGRRGVPAIAGDILRPHISMGARAMIAAALHDAGITMSDPDLDSAYEDFLGHYAERIAELSRPFPELLAALDTLDAAGVGLAVCTNKREQMAKTLLGALELAPRFRFIAGIDTFSVSKPHPGHLTSTVEAAGGTIERTVFVGDSDVDYKTARAAGVPFVGLAYGYSNVPMAELGPDRLMQREEDVGAAILGLMRAPAG
ncbi:phosphoglycolate phosphatase [Acuticoccus sediminis]|uniref:phosphoglycolate phosphatase n=1 Tax=Acuticoccus sediminis TaxID=2184697 RepID=A0A8B2NHZ9_9HYPH|nr:HAD-IA family hydrolase [Acuticoccus sediminis]RAH97033.1 phosphoglycolate phosphatase [Acuticoccus sediminis]